MTGRERQAAVDMTRGSPVKLILRFTLPLLIGQMMQQIYTLTDTMITGHFIGDAAIAAIGASTSLNDLMINVQRMRHHYRSALRCAEDG